ncbi:DNA-binding response regulator [Pseudorhizobium endolithicum]|uniref:DNA-binding response regulator n=1 Tax=Pseudorhizobium endolithicum TaxID=1191678 RepID=A0ABN7JUV1_9HYPH|nr:response regulator transcription factor [Pseudorhizobium endolithicum]CAD7044432.1 DNA-binding response regulator [Pseudorhizobium endolithicum]
MDNVIVYTPLQREAASTIGDDVAQGSADRQRLGSGYVALIDHRILDRECLAHSLKYHKIGWPVLTFATLEELRAAALKDGPPTAVLFNTGNRFVNHQHFCAGIEEMVAALAPAPVVVLSEDQAINTVLDVIGLGARGYIPTSNNIEVCVQAISLAIAGGRFLPASSVLAMRELPSLVSETMPALRFTERQTAVAEALRCGKANKVIAAELNLCESTVKVHIRNIMKKLGATNRTEVASKIAEAARKADRRAPAGSRTGQP